MVKKVKINRKHKFGDNSFIKGKLVGFGYALSICGYGSGKQYSIGRDANYHYIRLDCNEEGYAIFKEFTDKHYSKGCFEGLLEFED